MSLLTRNTTPAERARGCTFSEGFESSALVRQNGGDIVGNPVIDFGATLDGVTDALEYPSNGVFGGDAFSAVSVFTPYFDVDLNTNVYFWYGPGSRYSFQKSVNPTNALTLFIGGTNVGSIEGTVWGYLWKINERNVIVVSGVSGNTNIWLNGVVVMDSDTTAWTPGVPTFITAGYNGTFEGILHSLKFFNQALTAQEALDYYNDSTYEYRNETSLYLPMGMRQHDPTNVRTLDVSGNDRHAVFGGDPSKLGTRHGYDFDGSDYLLGNVVGLYNSSKISYAVEFNPSFGYDIDQSLYLLDASAVGRHYIIKYNAASGYVLSFKLGDGIGSNVPSATYGPYWRVGGRNILIVSADGVTLQIVLNGVLIRSVVYTFTPTNPPLYSIGSSYGGAGNFSGKFHSFRVWRKALTPLQIHDLSINAQLEANQS